MKTENILVTDKDGVVSPAICAVCEFCSSNKFMIAVILGHNHLLCSNCGTSYCQDGSCDRPDPGRCACGEDH